MNATTAPAGAGRQLAERLGLRIVGVEGHDLRVECIVCDSPDKGRVHKDTAVYHCYRCGKALNAFDLSKVVLGDHEAAKRLMHEVGLFPELFTGGRGNGEHVKPTAGDRHLTDEQVLEAVARFKGVSASAFKAYGAIVRGGSVVFPMFGPDGKLCSTFTITLNKDGTADKGLNAANKPSGLFFPCELSRDGRGGKVRRPQPGETWIFAEGVKDAAALGQMGFMAVGLPTNRLNEKFAPLFQGVAVVIVPDQDKAGEKGAAATAKAVHPVAKSVRRAIFPIEFAGRDIRDMLKRLGPEAGAEMVRKAIAEAVPVNAEGEVEDLPRFVEVVTCPELLALNLRPWFLIRRVLVAGQLAVVGARAKGMKTSVAVDLAVSLGSGAAFLGEFSAERVKVGFWSGESGAVTLRETAARIASSKGVDLAACSISWGFTLPKLGSTNRLKA